jgi:hypothetical protein
MCVRGLMHLSGCDERPLLKPGGHLSETSVLTDGKDTTRQVNMTISLAFLTPDLVKAAVEGRLPRGIGVTRLRDAPAEWSRQYAMFGLSI